MLSYECKIYIAGHRGMVGTACWQALENAGYVNLIGKTSKELDLRNQAEVENFISKEKPDAIVDAAARVGGILANDSYPYEFLMDNMLIQNNLIRSAHKNDVSKFVFLGSSCIYPKLATQPIKEEYLLTDSLEPTNEWYAIAKISGVKLIEALRKQFKKDYVALMPTNLYGPNDNFDLATSHVLPAMIRKFHEAKVASAESVTLWGSGMPKREFLHVSDLGRAVLHALQNSMSSSLYNVGTGLDISIKDLADKIASSVGFSGNIDWDISKPDGTPRKLLDVSRLKDQGWQSEVDLDDGIEATYNWFLKNSASLREVKMT